MTPSIIRRFAKYHGIGLDSYEPGEATICELAEAVHGTADYDRIAETITALTRIEDAEAAIYLAKAWAIGTSQYNALHILANNLFESVYIDPAKWREVKE